MAFKLVTELEKTPRMHHKSHIWDHSVFRTFFSPDPSPVGSRFTWVGCAIKHRSMTHLWTAAETGLYHHRFLLQDESEPQSGWLQSVREIRFFVCLQFLHIQSSRHCIRSFPLSPSRPPPRGWWRNVDTQLQPAPTLAPRRPPHYHFRFRRWRKMWARAWQRSRAEWYSSAGPAPRVARTLMLGTDRKLLPDIRRKCSPLPVSAEVQYWPWSWSSAPQLSSDVIERINM